MKTRLLDKIHLRLEKLAGRNYVNYQKMQPTINAELDLMHKYDYAIVKGEIEILNKKINLLLSKKDLTQNWTSSFVESFFPDHASENVFDPVKGG